MAFALIGLGLLLFMAAYQNNVAALGSQLSADITGSRGFLIWFVAIFIIGALGYVPLFKNVSRAFLVLILVVIVLSNRGFFAQFVSTLGVPMEGEDEGGLNMTPSTPPTTPTTPTNGG